MKLLDTAIRAIEQVSPALKMVILQTGGKGYGFEFSGKVCIDPPLRESMPRIPEPYASKIFYYTQYDLLTELSKGKDWTFAEVRPDGIVGFTPISNAMIWRRALESFWQYIAESTVKVPRLIGLVV